MSKMNEQTSVGSNSVWISVSELQAGMFVESIESDWRDTPFVFQGVYIFNERDIQRLAKWTSKVLVKIDKPGLGVVNKVKRMEPRLNKAVPIGNNSNGIDLDRNETSYFFEENVTVKSS